MGCGPRTRGSRWGLVASLAPAHYGEQDTARKGVHLPANIQVLPGQQRGWIAELPLQY